MTQPEFNGWQSLRAIHNADGTVNGVLDCTVTLSLSASHSLELTDVVADIAVGCVLNPINGVFLADEIQRLMRIGLSVWLMEELNEHSLAEVSTQEHCQILRFSLLDLSGVRRTLAIDIASGTQQDSLVPLARECLRHWAKHLPMHPTVEWVSDELAQADLSRAPLLRCGLAQMNQAATV